MTDPAAKAAIGAPAARCTCPPSTEADSPHRDRHSPGTPAARPTFAELLTAECDDRHSRRRVQRVDEAKSHRYKRLADFDRHAHPTLPPATLAAGDWLDAGGPVAMLGDTGNGTGKTDLFIGPGTATTEAGRGRYAPLDLFCLHEVGYVHLDPAAG